MAPSHGTLYYCMKKPNLSLLLATAGIALGTGCAHPPAAAPAADRPATPPPPVPRFSVKHMDPSVNPGTDFFRYACGDWLSNNPVPADKSSWGAFAELNERNLQLIHGILLSTSDGGAKPASPRTPLGEVAAFYASAMNTNRLEELGFAPLQEDFARIAAVKSPAEVLRLVAGFHHQGVPAMFGAGISPDAKNSSYYAFQMSQGGLGLPDRDYYLSPDFAAKREAYQTHIAKMFVLAGETQPDATAQAATIVDLETALAKASKDRADLRDPIANYHKFTLAEAEQKYPRLELPAFSGRFGHCFVARGDHSSARIFCRAGRDGGPASAGRLESLFALARHSRRRAVSERGGGKRVVRVLRDGAERAASTGAALAAGGAHD